MGPAPAREDLLRICAATLLGGLVALALTFAPRAGGADLENLQAKLSHAKDEAGALSADLRRGNEQLAVAQAEAREAEARENRLSGLLGAGEERAAQLAAKVERTEDRLYRERRRLRRARRALAQRLVALYEGGTASAASVILESTDLDELATRSEYLQRIQDSDTELATRVEQVRNTVRGALVRVSELKARIDAHNERLAAARAQIASVRGRAEAAAARLRSLSAARSASLSNLKSKMDEWVAEIEKAEAASREAAEETVGRWLGGPFSIPAYIVMCESGGNYSALNPSSGAGGAYQILPSTWDLYGGRGAPHEAPKAEQDEIAAQIWADSGPGAWVCAG